VCQVTVFLGNRGAKASTDDLLKEKNTVTKFVTKLKRNKKIGGGEGRERERAAQETKKDVAPSFL
jgi:hypothetical protein